MAEKVVPVSRLLDERGLGSFQIKLIIWSFFIVLVDGYDIAAIAFAAPSLVREWGLKPGALGPVFSASLIGILFGSALFGWVGDRYGRKAALVWSNLLFGVFTLAAAYSTNLDQMFWLRLLAGLGIGGVIPNVVAINAEIRAAQIACNSGDYRGWLRADRRRDPRLRRRGARAATWMADHLHDRRDRANRDCHCRNSACRNRSSTWHSTKASAARWSV